MCSNMQDEFSLFGYGFIAVHVGAGYHSLLHEKDYKQACRAACAEAMKAIKQGFSAKDVVTNAITALEIERILPNKMKTKRVLLYVKYLRIHSIRGLTLQMSG